MLSKLVLTEHTLLYNPVINSGGGQATAVLPEFGQVKTEVTRHFLEASRPLLTFCLTSGQCEPVERKLVFKGKTF